MIKHFKELKVTKNTHIKEGNYNAPGKRTVGLCVGVRDTFGNWMVCVSSICWRVRGDTSISSRLKDLTRLEIFRGDFRRLFAGEVDGCITSS